jgi:hypothetical protein
LFFDRSDGEARRAERGFRARFQSLGARATRASDEKTERTRAEGFAFARSRVRGSVSEFFSWHGAYVRAEPQSNET